MFSRQSNKASRVLIASWVLSAFAGRALIAQGFMPAGDRAFSIVFCPDGFPAQFLAQGVHQHRNGHSYAEHCVFGTTCAKGPPPEFLELPGVSLTDSAPVLPSVSTAIVVGLVHLPHARGPPATV